MKPIRSSEDIEMTAEPRYGVPQDRVYSAPRRLESCRCLLVLRCRKKACHVRVHCASAGQTSTPVSFEDFNLRTAFSLSVNQSCVVAAVAAVGPAGQAVPVTREAPEVRVSPLQCRRASKA